MAAGISIDRVGAVAGLAAVAGIIGLEIVGPIAVAGQRVSGTLDGATIAAYYGHAALLPFYVSGFLLPPVALVFVLALRSRLGGGDPLSAFLAGVGAAFFTVEAGLLLVQDAVQVTLLDLAARNADAVLAFRFWDVLYNGATYALECGLAFAVSAAVLRGRRLPAWVAWLGLLAGALQLFNMTSLFIGVGDNATLPGNVALLAWLASLSILLWRPAALTGRVDSTP